MNINEMEIFSGLDDKVKEEISNASSTESYAKNTILFKKGEKAGYLYILEQGNINLMMKDEEVVCSLTKPGEVFGWSSIIEKGIYTATCVCVTDVTASRIKKEKIEDIFNRHLKAAVLFYRRLGAVFSKRLAKIS